MADSFFCEGLFHDHGPHLRINVSDFGTALRGICYHFYGKIAICR
jgi:hypothetical protein